MGFKFRYTAPLSYREHLKEKAEIEFGNAQKQLQKARQILRSFETRLEEARISLAQRLHNRMTSDEMAMYSDYMTATRKRIVAQKQEVAKRERIVAEKRKSLLERTKEYRIIEKLMEKDHQTWKHQQEFEEQKRINEVAVTRHGKAYL